MHGMQMEVFRIRAASSSIRRWPRTSVMISSARALGHRLFHKVSGLVDGEPVAPEDVHVVGLSDEMRLIWQYNRQEPGRVHEGDQAPFARHVTGRVHHDPEEGGVVLGGGERDPFGFVDMVVKGGRAAEFGPAGRDLLPERPGPAVGLALEDRAPSPVVPRLDASVIDPRVTITWSVGPTAISPARPSRS